MIKLNPAAEVIFGLEARHVGKPVAEMACDSRIAIAVAEALHSQRPVVEEGAAAVFPWRSRERSAPCVCVPPRRAMRQGGCSAL